jgi:predicted HicB family RNase H-like nuclease
MRKVLEYRGYSAAVEFDADDELFTGRIAGINDVIGFHADTVSGLKAAFRESVDDYLAACEKTGKAPEKPYSGKVMFRIAPAVHAQAARAAQLEGKSMNQWGEEALAEKASRSG